MIHPSGSDLRTQNTMSGFPEGKTRERFWCEYVAWRATVSRGQGREFEGGTTLKRSESEVGSPNKGVVSRRAKCAQGEGEKAGLIEQSEVSPAFLSRQEVIGSVERPLTDNCLYAYFGSDSERK